ncbi:MAG TPA: SpoIIE family protein phosphatase [Candidatus Ornithocaccomicrobium faecavium]|uniref:SpoIIE family protein phosphatase n=1 Tax=Candidatus Ornithocaccomicrobium faecavium TaxID=2840890 RepID=A0A9D1P8Y5_9FIRM|nr:SpoIIE family protein phosphatase [Clostridiales bacterium]HIV28247.1 SpoIIE family protein phosphatase [Candidatus Ornithocaccomicrobium faecavium]
MNNLWTETGYVSLNKTGEQLCGDRVEVTGGGEANHTTLVLADGLGSGVKANILSTLTSKILCTMISGGMPIESCVETIAETLPVCSVRKVAYSTFSIISVTDNEIAELIQFDNPEIIVLRGGVRYDYPMTTRQIAGKTIHESRFPVEENDVFIAMSDGATYAGVGHALNHGWQRENIIDFAEANYLPGNSAKYIAGNIVDECNRLYEGEPGDDTTVAVVRIRARHPVNLMIGPPSTKDQDIKMMNLFFAKQGEKIICGGTTATIASRYLHRELKPTLDYPDPEIPPISQLDGVDLVTEGVVTISRVLKYAEDFLNGTDLSASWSTRRDGASLIARELFEKATDINFFVGRAINPAHQNPDLPITFGIKIQLIENLAKCLEKMGKQIKVSYF